MSNSSSGNNNSLDSSENISALSTAMASTNMDNSSKDKNPIRI